MKTYDVCVHYQADVHMQITAESEEAAQQEALKQAGMTVPYDSLYFDGAYIDEVEHESDIL